MRVAQSDQSPSSPSKLLGLSSESDQTEKIKIAVKSAKFNFIGFQSDSDRTHRNPIGISGGV